ncbi:hypothetical protein [Leptospira santarosai]|uniref:hypothetical protein n=1 Tax=Leptospira santarosai TaxID=28183 RepID=UPI000A5CEA4C
MNFSFVIDRKTAISYGNLISRSLSLDFTEVVLRKKTPDKSSAKKKDSPTNRS